MVAAVSQECNRVGAQGDRIALLVRGHLLFPCTRKAVWKERTDHRKACIITQPQPARAWTRHLLPATAEDRQATDSEQRQCRRLGNNSTSPNHAKHRIVPSDARPLFCSIRSGVRDG